MCTGEMERINLSFPLTAGFENKHTKLLFHTQNIMNEKHLNLKKKSPAIIGYLD
jgi:hypothetical protein